MVWSDRETMKEDSGASSLYIGGKRKGPLSQASYPASDVLGISGVTGTTHTPLPSSGQMARMAQSIPGAWESSSLGRHGSPWGTTELHNGAPWWAGMGRKQQGEKQGFLPGTRETLILRMCGRASAKCQDRSVGCIATSGKPSGVKQR